MKSRCPRVSLGEKVDLFGEKIIHCCGRLLSDGLLNLFGEEPQSVAFISRWNSISSTVYLSPFFEKQSLLVSFKSIASAVSLKGLTYIFITSSIFEMKSHPSIFQNHPPNNHPFA